LNVQIHDRIRKREKKDNRREMIRTVEIVR